MNKKGMTGISTRFIMKAIDNAFSDSENNSINPILMLDALQSKVKEEPLAEDLKKAILRPSQRSIVQRIPQDA